MVKEQDYPRYLAMLFMPREKREGALSLLMFALEIWRIPAAVSEPMLGHIRYSWWREAVEEMFAGKRSRAHPVLEALAPVIASGRVMQEDFVRLIDVEEEVFAGEQEQGEDRLLPLLCAWGGEGKWRRAYKIASDVSGPLTPWGKVKLVLKMWSC